MITELLLIQVILMICFAGCYVVPRNIFYGVKFKYTLASDTIWRAANRKFASISLIISLPFLPAFLIAGKENQHVLFIIETAALVLATIYIYFFSKEKYFQDFPQEKEVYEANVSSNLAKKGVGKRDAIIALLICTGFVALFCYQYFYEFAPIWNKKIATHWNASGVPNGFMTGAQDFLFTLKLSLIPSVIFIIGGCALAQKFVYEFARIRFTPLTIILPIVFMICSFFAAINELSYASYLANSKLTNSSLGTFLFVCAGVSFATIILSTLLLSTSAYARKK